MCEEFGLFLYQGWQEHINSGTKIELDIKEASWYKRQYILFNFTLE